MLEKIGGEVETNQGSMGAIIITPYIPLNCYSKLNALLRKVRFTCLHLCATAGLDMAYQLINNHMTKFCCIGHIC